MGFGLRLVPLPRQPVDLGRQPLHLGREPVAFGGSSLDLSNGIIRIVPVPVRANGETIDDRDGEPTFPESRLATRKRVPGSE